MHARAGSGFLLLAAGLAACEPTAVPTRIEVSPGVDTADAIGATLQFTARVYDQLDAPIPGAEVEWWIRGRDVATISPTGLVTAVGQGRTDIGANHESLAGYAKLVVALRPRALEMVSGDRQRGPALRALPHPPTVLVLDASGAPIPEIVVEFEASDNGIARPVRRPTDTHGEAATEWVLGLPVGTQTLRASVEGHTFEFAATATDPLLSIPAAILSRGRLTVPYRAALEARGGTGPLFWSIESGSLPEGLGLDSTGVIAGAPAEIDSTAFTVHVRDTDGNEASRGFALQVCAAPLQLAPGEIVLVDPAAALSCPPFLPAGGEGDRYRVAAVRTDVVDDPTRVSVVVKVNRAGFGGPETRVSAHTPGPRPEPRLPPALAAGLRIADESSRMHARLLAGAERLVEELGAGAVLPDRRPEARRDAAGVAMRGDPPPERTRLRPYLDYRKPCEDPPPALKTAFLVGYNDDLAIYQDSAQQGLSPIPSAHAQMVLDYYEEFGAPTIEEYFGGVPDVNGDGRANVFVSPVVPPGVAAFVWAGDFLSRDACSWSNEMELIYYNRILFDFLEHAPDSGYQALPTMVHEAKHLGSLYVRTLRLQRQPNWIEEGTAEIAAEISSRMALEAAGGVVRGARLDRDAYPPGEDIVLTPENYGVLLRLARMTVSYSGVLNSLSADPSEQHSYYGTSWHFHRYLGDAYGNAAARADGAFFTALNDSSTPPGIPGIRAVTGRNLSLHMVDYAAAMMLNGAGAPEPDPGFTTYDFPSATSGILGPFLPESDPEDPYPWFHTGPEPAGFVDAIYSGTLSPGGIRFHEFESDGTGSGIELEVTASDERGAVRILIVRVR